MELEDNYFEDSNEKKPTILKAVELILANPNDIIDEVNILKNKYENQYQYKKSPEDIKALVVKKIISNYSYWCAFVGGATGLTGIVPGLGTVISMFGGTVADIALCMKFQIEMVMAIATVYEHDILIEEEKRLCMLIAGLGTLNEAAKEGGKAVARKAVVKVIQQYLKGSVLVAIKEIFKKIGITFTRKAVEKSAPFGISVILGYGANKALTVYVGKQAKTFFDLN